MSSKVGTMPYFLKNIEQVLIKDEILMRLLKYQPEDLTGVSPLDDSLPEVVPDFDTAKEDEIDEYWELVNERFRRGLKRTDIENESIVVIYMYEGRKFRIFGNDQLSKQEVRFTILAHESYESDSRFSWISDRLSYLLAGEKYIAGIGKLRFVSSKPFEAPLGYRKVEETYEFTTNTKRLWK